MFPFITEEHEMIQEAARDFAQGSIAPIAAHFDETGEFPLETVRQMGQLGFMGIETPEEYGGVEILHVPSEHIWLPDIVLYNK